MSRYRYETRTNQARRDARQTLITYVACGLFLCLTIIGAPMGVVVIIVGFVQHSRSSSAISSAAQRREDEAFIRAARSL